MGLSDFFRKKQKKPDISALLKRKDMSKADIYRTIFRSIPPSAHFSSGPVFIISQKNRDAFMQAVTSSDALALIKLFIASYNLFLEHPQVALFTPEMLNKALNDTNPYAWNTSIYKHKSGDYIVLLYMPIQQEELAARMVGIIFSNGQRSQNPFECSSDSLDTSPSHRGSNSSNGRSDGCYYCMLNKNESEFSDVERNKSTLIVEKVGKVKGRGFDLRDSFLACIMKDFYQDLKPEENTAKLTASADPIIRRGNS